MPLRGVNKVIEELSEIITVRRIGPHLPVLDFVSSRPMPSALTVTPNRIHLDIPSISNTHEAIEITPKDGIERVITHTSGCEERRMASLATFIEELFKAYVDELCRRRNFDVVVAALTELQTHQS